MRTKLNIKFLANLTHDEKHALAIYLMVRNRFVSGRVYEFSYKKLSREINVSVHLLKKYLPLILKKKWGTITKDNQLVMFGIRRVLKARGFKNTAVHLGGTDTIRTVVDRINLILLENNLKTQEFVLKVKDYLHKGKRMLAPGERINIKKYKNLQRKYESTYGRDGFFTESPIIGVRRLAQVLRSSISYAARFLNRIAAMGWVSLEEVCYVEEYNVPSDFLEWNNYPKGVGFLYVHRNTLIRHMGRQVVVNDSTQSTIPPIYRV